VTTSVPNQELFSLKVEYDRQHTMLRMVDEKKADPERERRGKPAVKTTLLVVDVKHDVAAALHDAAVQVADVSVG